MTKGKLDIQDLSSGRVRVGWPISVIPVELAVEATGTDELTLVHR